MNMGQLAGFRRWGYDTRGWALTTQKRYSNTIISADRWLHDDGRPELMAAGLDDLKAWMTTRTTNAGTRNGYRDALVAYFDWAMDVSLRRDNPAAALPRLPVPRGLPRALHPEDARLVLDASHAYGLRWVALCKLAFYAGLRATELITLRWVDLSHDMARIRGKGGHARDVPLAPCAAEALEEWRGACPSPVWVFPSPRFDDRHQSYGWTHRTMQRIAADAGVAGFHPHVGRHTTATTLLDTGADVRDVQALLGHVNLATTSRYLAVRPARVVAAVGRLAY